MSTIVLSKKAERLIELCDAEGFESVGDLLEAVLCDGVCPAICMDCGVIARLDLDQCNGYCEQCNKNRVVSALVLADLI